MFTVDTCLQRKYHHQNVYDLIMITKYSGWYVAALRIGLSMSTPQARVSYLESIAKTSIGSYFPAYGISLQFQFNSKNIYCHNVYIDDIQNRFLTGKYSVIHQQQGIYQHIMTKGARNPSGFMGSKSETLLHLKYRNSAGCRVQICLLTDLSLCYSKAASTIICPWNELYHRSNELYFHITMARYQFISSRMRFLIL